MKKQILIILSLLLPLMAIADAVPIDGIYYNLNTEIKTAEVTRNPNNYKGSIVISPLVVFEGITYHVTSIGNVAFASSSLSSVVIPEGVTSIGESAFDHCYDLTTVSLPEGITRIADSAFESCVTLNSIKLPSSLQEIGIQAFMNCFELTSINIPQGIKTIPFFCFSGSGIKSIVFPEGLEEIGESAFSCCGSLESAILPSSLTTLGHKAFEYCGLKTIDIPENVTKLDMTFSGCGELSSVFIRKGINEISNSTFESCYNLSSIVVEGDNSVYDSRDNCNAIIETATNTLIVGCKNTIIPSSISKIGNSAFNGSGIQSIVIPGNIKRIYESAFANTELNTIVIHNGIEYIGASAFAGCYSISDFYCYSELIPTTSGNLFEWSDLNNAILHVPASAIESYRNKAPWNQFANIVAIEETIPKQCATPTITFINGKVKFVCETKDVEFVPTVTCVPSQALAGDELEFGSTFKIYVYARREGYLDSEVATATITMSSAGDLNGDGKITIADVTSLVNVILGK